MTAAPQDNAFYPDPDPNNVLTLDEVMGIAEATDPSLVPRQWQPAAVTDADGEYVSHHVNPPSMAHPIASSQRCAHTSDKTGRRCKKWAESGLEHCHFHARFGAATGVLKEFVLDYARRNLYEMAPLALDVMSEIMSNEDVSPAVRLKAATETLDRIGVRGGTEVDVTVEARLDDPAAEIRARLERLAGPSAASLALEAIDDGDLDVVDAELVEPPPTAAEIRAWAHANDVAVPSRGRIPATVMRLYRTSARTESKSVPG